MQVVVIFVVHPVSSSTPPAERTSSATVAVIPARYESSRFPGKALADIDGRPMIEHVYRRVAATPSISTVIVATDDERIHRAVERFGGMAQMTLTSHASGTDRVAEVAEGLDCDIIVNVQGDEPLIEPAMIEEAIAPLRVDPAVLMSTLRRRIEDPADLYDPNVSKVVVDRNDFALYFSRAPIPYPRAANRRLSPLGWKHVGLYVYRRTFLLTFARLAQGSLELAESLEQLRALEHGYRIKAVETAYESVGVDTHEDLERVRRILSAAARA